LFKARLPEENVLQGYIFHQHWKSNSQTWKQTESKIKNILERGRKSNSELATFKLDGVVGTRLTSQQIKGKVRCQKKTRIEKGLEGAGKGEGVQKKTTT